MKKIKFITFTDVHISDINPVARLGNYKKDILEKLRQIGAAGKKLGVDFYLFGGDLFHIKAPIKNTHNLVVLLTDTFKNYGAPIYSTEGNHDLRGSYDNIDEQPIQVLYSSGTLKQLREERLDIRGIKLVLRSMPFNEKADPQLPPLNREEGNCDVSVCTLHLYATPDGGRLFKNRLYSYDELAATGDDIYFLGHYHIDQGIRVLNKEHPQYFINVGAVSRGTTSEDNIKRDPKIAYVEIEKDDSGKITIKAQAIKLKVKPAAEVFDLAEKEAEKIKIEATSEFAEKLQKDMDGVVTNTVSLEDEVTKLQAEQEIIDSVKYYLDQADLVLKELAA
jgi:DNA repair exonuclease SbcCD nuclease subunit